MSSDDIAIRVDNVTKSFRVDGKGVQLGASEAAARETAPKGRFRALNDVSISVKRGETVGIVGRNGAGKSTLLRIICGMMKPDSGEVFVDGEAYSVMGMGIGFNRTLTGWENIEIKGAVMGASSREIRERLDWIVDFAELGDYINQPLRTYSKGMLSRLAFAVTFAFDPNILVVDEALSGGDGAIKRKAEARLNEINDSGATILLVSHGKAHHLKLCDRSILLDKGVVLTEGPPEVIFSYYDQLLDAGPENEAEVIQAIRRADPYASLNGAEKRGARPGAAPQGGPLLPAEDFFDPDLSPGSRSESKPGGGRIRRVEFVASKSGEPLNTFLAGSKLRLEVEVEFARKMENVSMEVTIKAQDGLELYRTRLPKPTTGRRSFKKGKIYTYRFTLYNRLLAGAYFVDTVLRGDTGDGEAVQHRVSDAAVLRSLAKGRGEGLIDLAQR